MFKKYSFSWQLLRTFLISTLIPFMLVTTVLANIYSRKYNSDIRTLVDSTVDSMTSNIDTYLYELKQVTLLPYYNDEIYNYLEDLAGDVKNPDIVNELSLRRNLESNMSFIRYNRSDINGIFIVKDRRCLYYTVNRSDWKKLSPDYDYAAQSWYRNAIAADGQCLVLGPHKPDYITPNDSDVISLVRSVVVLNSREPLYVIKFDINTSIFARIFSGFSFHVNSKILIRDENEHIIYTNAALSESDSGKLSSKLSGDSIKLSDGAYQTYSYPIGDYPWTITILLSRSEMQSKTNLFYALALLLYLLGTVVAMLSYVTINRKIVTAIEHMKKVFHAIRRKDFSARYEYVSNTELDDLGRSLNHTAEQLENRIQKEYLMTIQQKDTEFRALEAQIQPHFLFNTINNFIALNQIGDQKTLEKYLYALSDMLRFVLRAPAFVSLSAELEFVDDYCALQKLRFSDRLSYRIIRNISGEKYKIPKLLLQPIVENSVIHGIEPCDHACQIIIEVRKENERIVLSVSDDGVGCLVDSIRDSIGLSNVQERLKSFCPDSTFQMTGEIGRGTTTVITIPEKDTEDKS